MTTAGAALATASAKLGMEEERWPVVTLGAAGVMDDYKRTLGAGEPVGDLFDPLCAYTVNEDNIGVQPRLRRETRPNFDRKPCELSFCALAEEVKPLEGDELSLPVGCERLRDERRGDAPPRTRLNNEVGFLMSNEREQKQRCLCFDCELIPKNEPTRLNVGCLVE